MRRRRAEVTEEEIAKEKAEAKQLEVAPKRFAAAQGKIKQ